MAGPDERADDTVAGARNSAGAAVCKTRDPVVYDAAVSRNWSSASWSRDPLDLHHHSHQTPVWKGAGADRLAMGTGSSCDVQTSEESTPISADGGSLKPILVRIRQPYCVAHNTDPRLGPCCAGPGPILHSPGPTSISGWGVPSSELQCSGMSVDLKSGPRPGTGPISRGTYLFVRAYTHSPRTHLSIYGGSLE